MKPRSECSEKISKKRIKIFEEMRLTSHHPTKAKMFPKHPQTYGDQNQN